MERRSLSPRVADAPLVPVVGMGTWQTLDTDDLDRAGEVVDAALDAGTKLFDSSPMYGRSEDVLGRALGVRRVAAVVATKVWTPDEATAERQIDASLGFFGGRIDLLQVHNMVGWQTRLDQIERRQKLGQVQLVGATHWQVSGFAELEAAMRSGRVDAVQIPYNPAERDVEARILPLAQDLGLGVLVMRPFAKAALLAQPPRAAELAGLEAFGITTWADALLQWCLGHPAITCAIPATSKPARARSNAAALDTGAPLLHGEQRDRVGRLFARRG